MVPFELDGSIPEHQNIRIFRKCVSGTSFSDQRLELDPFHERGPSVNHYSPVMFQRNK